MERRIGFIPNATWVTEPECALFVTDQRTIVVKNEDRPKGVRANLKATIGAEADRLPQPRPAIDFATVDIASLAGMPGNESIPHMSLEKITIGKRVGGYGIWAQVIRDDMKKDYLVVGFVAPPALIKRRKAEGVSARETRRRYALRCQEVYRKALPPLIAEKVVWKT